MRFLTPSPSSPSSFEAARLGITGRAFRELGHGLHTHSYRPFAGNAFGHVDDSPFGGGPGMVLRPEVLRDTLASVPRQGAGKVIHFSPAAPPLTHARVLELAHLDQLILVCTRYEGLDQRAVEACIDEEFSIGEAVLSGGDCAGPLPHRRRVPLAARGAGERSPRRRTASPRGLLTPPLPGPAVFEGLEVRPPSRRGPWRHPPLASSWEAMARTKRLGCGLTRGRPSRWDRLAELDLPRPVVRSGRWSTRGLGLPEAEGLEGLSPARGSA
ncbi:MAG: hypothetical protein IPN91_03590 [Holophagaceae bacterium]|uniref:tRNA methyltransferase TRMD/TRM10-type domain-containing protein n=1 Tax=Candidatus Geothrix odensensis TaxID=2954440 RepID=A0A936F235_9BACT|nr:hypothetical protein [Candidatus Geothrix odensensis]